MVEAKNLTKYYGKNKSEVRALKGVSFSLPDKGLIFIVGKSGSGKSTLLNLLCGLDDATSGSVFVNGTDICALKPHELDNYRNYFVGIIYQNFNLFEEDTVINNIKIASDIAENPVSDDEILNIIRKVDIEGKENSLVRELSGGQKQRVAIARALIKNPQMIVADEPTGNLDSKTSKLIFDTFREISSDKLVVIVSHDMENAKNYADRIIELADGNIVSDSERNPEFNGEFKNVVISSGGLSDEELSEVNEVIKEKGLKLTSSDEQFIPFNKEILSTGEKVDFKGKNSSWKNSLHLSLKFLKSAWISLIVAVFLSSMIIGLLVLSEQFSRFDGAEAMETVVNKYGFDSVIYNKGYSYTDSTTNINKDYAIEVTERDIQQFKDAGYTGKIYPIYATPVYNGKFDLEQNKIHSDSDIKHIYIEEGLGTMVTDMDYLNRIFGGVEIAAGSLYNAENSTGIIVTDYFADGILARNVAKRIDSIPIYSFDQNDIYQNIIGCKIDNRYHISAVIKTDYREKYKWMFTMYEKLQKEKQNADILAKELYSSNLYAKFVEDVENVLGVTYSLNPNFIEDFYSSKQNIIHFDCQGFSAYNDEGQMLEAYDGNSYVYADDSLSEGEVYVSESRFLTFFSGEAFSSDKDYYIVFKQYGLEQNSTETPKLEKRLKVVGTFANNDSNKDQLHFMMSWEDSEDFMSNTYLMYALCFDDISQLNTVNDVAMENYFYTRSTSFTAIANLINIVLIFSKIFSYIAVVLIIMVTMFIVFHNLRIIKNNQYRLGVYKSLGYSSLALGESTLLNSLYLIVFIFILSIIITLIMSGAVNGILTASFAKYLGNELYASLTLVEFSMPTLLKYVGIVFGLTIVSTFIPVISIRKIKPNIIINKAE